jgi:hypothetical protein
MTLEGLHYSKNLANFGRAIFGRNFDVTNGRAACEACSATELVLKVKVKVKVTLRLTVSQSVSFGVEPHLGLMTRYLLLFDSYGLVFCGAPSLTRGRVCLLHMLLVLASAVFLWSESLWTHVRPYFTVSDLRLPFSSPPTTRMVTVEVFDPASTREGIRTSSNVVPCL